MLSAGCVTQLLEELVLAPEILVNFYMIPPSTYLAPLRFLFFLGILGGMGFTIAVWWKMSKLLFLKKMIIIHAAVGWLVLSARK